MFLVCDIDSYFWFTYHFSSLCGFFTHQYCESNSSQLNVLIEWIILLLLVWVQSQIPVWRIIIITSFNIFPLCFHKSAEMVSLKTQYNYSLSHTSTTHWSFYHSSLHCLVSSNSIAKQIMNQTLGFQPTVSHSSTAKSMKESTQLFPHLTCTAATSLQPAFLTTSRCHCLSTGTISGCPLSLKLSFFSSMGFWRLCIRFS